MAPQNNIRPFDLAAEINLVASIEYTAASLQRRNEFVPVRVRISSKAFKPLTLVRTQLSTGDEV